MKKFYFELHNLVEEKKTSRRILIMVLHKVLNNRTLSWLIKRIRPCVTINVERKALQSMHEEKRYNQCMKKYIFTMNTVEVESKKMRKV
jgi:hypothetical protein